MRVVEVIEKYGLVSHLRTLKDQCSTFLSESEGYPLIKSLPCDYPNFHKVKVRNKRRRDQFDNTFNEAFETEHLNLRQRAIFVTPTHSVPNGEPYYIFPIDGYRFMYSKDVKNSNEDYRQVFNMIIEQFGNEKSHGVVADLLKLNYVQTSLHEGIESESEIIIYNIPFYYAFKCSFWGDYDNLLSQVSTM